MAVHTCRVEGQGLLVAKKQEVARKQVWVAPRNGGYSAVSPPPRETSGAAPKPPSGRAAVTHSGDRPMDGGERG
jgi:hypothetical protein